MSITDRLVKIMKAKDLKQKEFGASIGKGASSISDWLSENKKSTPSFDSLKRIVEVHNINPTWLLTGEGEMFLSKPEKAPLTDPEGTTIVSKPLGTPKRQISMSDFEETVRVPLYGNIACGTPRAITHWQGKFVEVPKNIIGDKSRAYHVMLANGDSMEPIIIHQDALLIEETELWEDVRGKVAAVMVGGETTLKKVEIHDTLKLTILKPFNLTFPDLLLKPDELEEVKLIGILKAQLRLY